MIQIKLLELKKYEAAGLIKYPLFVEALNKTLGYNVEKVQEKDPLFNGYYLMPIGGVDINEFDKNLIDEKVFLLSVVNFNIPEYLKECKPAGLTNWRFFKDAKTTIEAKTDVLRKQKVNNNDYQDMYLNYSWYRPFPSDGTYETVARSILKYLELYDIYLKNK